MKFTISKDNKGTVRSQIMNAVREVANGSLPDHSHIPYEAEGGQVTGRGECSVTFYDDEGNRPRRLLFSISLEIEYDEDES